MVPESTRGCQRVPDGARGCQMVPEGARGCQMGSKSTRGCQRVPDGARECQMVPEGARGCQRSQDGMFMAPVLDKSSPLVTAEVIIAGVKVVALIDTGVTSSCCRWGWYDQWKAHLGPLKQTDTW